MALFLCVLLGGMGCDGGSCWCGAQEFGREFRFIGGGSGSVVVVVVVIVA